MLVRWHVKNVIVQNGLGNEFNLKREQLDKFRCAAK
jgi:hypothetical protein